MPNRVADLDIGAVQRADCYCPVHSEFHVACARRLPACRGDLFRQICGGIHAVTIFDVEVWQEYHLENLRYERVLIDGSRDGVDQLDDQFGHAVSGSGLAAEDDRSGRARSAGVTPEPVVKSDQVYEVQVLALVLVQPLHLDVEERARIYEYVGSLLDEARQNSLIISLDGLPILLEFGVRDQPFQLRELVLQICYPPVADMTGDQRTQFRI